jgi:hypothetical protein
MDYDSENWDRRDAPDWHLISAQRSALAGKLISKCITASTTVFSALAMPG